MIPSQTENAAANGDTRTLTIYHAHTKESTTVTFRVNGSYDSAALEKLNWALRDWRRDEPTKMDPRLFDVVWEVYRETGSSQPIWIMSAYRSPETNAMLRRRSRGVAEFSQHMLGKAMDVHMPDISVAKVREIAMRLQRGGVGFYPTAGTPFVHIDVGSVRYWPRMSRDQMARIFPDGKTVDIPADGQPMPRYNEALAEIQARGGSAYSASVEAGKSGNIFAAIFGGGDGDDNQAEAPGPTYGRRLVSVNTGNPGRPVFNATPPAATAQVNIAGAASRGGSPLAWAAIQSAPAQATATTVATMRPLDQPTTDPARSAPKPPTVVEKDASRKTIATVALAGNAPVIPMPPRRPTDLVVADLGPVPMPPTRPTDLALLASSLPVDGAPAAALSRIEASAAALPDVITLGTSKAAAHGAVLAFAEVPDVPHSSIAAATAKAKVHLTVAPASRISLGRSRPEFVAARIDRSNFRTLTASAPTTQAIYAALGSALAPLRQAARIDTDATLFQASVIAISTFGPAATGDLTCDHFTGPAVAPLSAADAQFVSEAEVE